MEAKNTENQSLTRNSSDNLSQEINSTSKEYVFAPVSYRVKLIISIAMLSFGVYMLIANSLILYFKHKQHRRRRRTIQRAFSRSLAEYFINSLALSDLLCSLISLPLFASELFVDFIKRDSICRLARFITIFFPVVTALNLLVIGIERYLGIFHPCLVISRRTAKRMVVRAWVLGVFITLVSVPSFSLVHIEDIRDNFYTSVCKYDNSVKSSRAFFIIFTFISYIVPSFILTFINLCILKRQQNSQRVDASQIARTAMSRLKVTRMFVCLIFAFIIPYFAFFAYSSFRTVMEVKVSFTDDYIARYISVFLAYANGSVSATILICYEKLYLDFLSCFRSRTTKNNVSKQARINIGHNQRKKTSSLIYQAPCPIKSVRKNDRSSSV